MCQRPNSMLYPPLTSKIHPTELQRDCVTKPFVGERSGTSCWLVYRYENVPLRDVGVIVEKSWPLWASGSEIQ